MTSQRYEIIKTSHILGSHELLRLMENEGSLFYSESTKLTNSAFVPGHDQLLSNEFDWLQKSHRALNAQLVFGFGGNVLWDLALQARADCILFSDWSPWPLLTQRFVIAPLLRLASTPQEFVFLISGLAREKSNGLSLEEVFAICKSFTLSPYIEQKEEIENFLYVLANEKLISDIELRFVSNLFRPRLGDKPIDPKSFGPYPLLESPNLANFTFHLEQRYNPERIGKIESVFSSLENFNFLKVLFDSNKISYALANIIDLKFYEKVSTFSSRKDNPSVIFSASNIFECGYYNGLKNDDFEKVRSQWKSVFANQRMQIFKTRGRSNPYVYEWLNENF